MANKKNANLPDLPPYVPKAIKRRLDHIETVTGVRPSLKSLDRNRWEIKLVVPRLELTCVETFRMGKPVGYLYASTLLVDGEERPWVNSYEELGMLCENLKDPEYVYDPYFIVPDLEPTPPAEEIPEDLRIISDKVSERLALMPEAGVEASFWPEDEFWVLGVNARERKTFSRLYLSRRKDGKVELTKTLLVVDGQNRTAEMGKTLESALMATMKAMVPGLDKLPGGTGPVLKGSSAPKVAQQSVRDHKSTVIRV